MSVLAKRYATWAVKTESMLDCTKGREGTELRNRFRTLLLREDLLGSYIHIQTLHGIVEAFHGERQNLRWVDKLLTDCTYWKDALNSAIRVSGARDDVIIRSLLDKEIDLEFALGLL